MALTIKDHIERGHYPKDDKGRALVPTGYGADTVAVICATDKPGTRCIVGWLPSPARCKSIECAWDEHGLTGGQLIECLLPPPPRKVQRTVALFIDKDTGEAKAIAEGHHQLKDFPNWRIKEFTYDHELPWDDKP